MIPKPAKMAFLPDKFLLTPETRIAFTPHTAETASIAEAFGEMILSVTGLDLPVLTDEQAPLDSNFILLATGQPLELHGEEGYSLSVLREHVMLSAATGRGLFYGVQTLRQLLSIDRSGPSSLPSLVIADRPRYPWRGFMLDCSRHFMDVAYIKRTLDLMAYHKLNVFHWHFVDGPGWRMEVESYPKLVEIGAWRGPEGDRYGGFYTKDEIREIVSYAGERYITVVPEFEMPGHSDAALAAYPELTCSGKPCTPPDGPLPNHHRDFYSKVDGSRPFCAGKDEVFRFHEAIFDEALELFPSPIYHVGGDERPTGIWDNCPHCRARMEAEGLADEHELQTWFMRRIADMLAKKGKRVTAWAVSRSNEKAPTDMDDLGHNAIVQNWHEGTAYAARQGWNVINSNSLFTYLDYPEIVDPEKPDWMSVLNLEKAYAFNPTPDGLSPEEASAVLGSEVCLWTEFVTQDQADLQIFPRLLAFVEVVWTPHKGLDFGDFNKRLAPHKAWLRGMGVEFRESGE